MFTHILSEKLEFRCNFLFERIHRLHASPRCSLKLILHKQPAGRDNRTTVPATMQLLAARLASEIGQQAPRAALSGSGSVGMMKQHGRGQPKGVKFTIVGAPKIAQGNSTRATCS